MKIEILTPFSESTQLKTVKQNEVSVIATGDHVTVRLTEQPEKKPFRGIDLVAGSVLALSIGLKDGWYIELEEDRGNDGRFGNRYLVVMRRRWENCCHVSGGYLSVTGEWKPEQRPLSPLPEDAVRIPIFCKEMAPA